MEFSQKLDQLMKERKLSAYKVANDIHCSQTTGVIGATAGVIGSIEATLAILHLLGLPAPLRNEIFYYYGRQMTSDRIRVERTPACPICGSLF